jgi:hypothetical protein
MDIDDGIRIDRAVDVRILLGATFKIFIHDGHSQAGWVDLYDRQVGPSAEDTVGDLK